ncbi:nucleoid occlusion factor SlmA [Massilia forsythiae]|uniref:Nucleoid occlusion factor SlmA n=1 Tax=Massilia forsythiae TaxID=2728020 RepID=A0A7Z2VVZ9_9BURK|nr:nucleoid occlusion factor SlmA [Massilia forsythiae]QJD99959.1 nucleoid occlusion factor SlmA [Massilia forsythiae]
MGSSKPGQRKQQILSALAAMLEHPKGDRITTAALAARMAVSEAALYRHFASKAQMFEGLIDTIEASVFGATRQIAEREPDGVKQAHAMLLMLLAFAADNQGMTRVLIGEALVGEDERLQLRMSGFYERVEQAFMQSLSTAAGQGHGRIEDVAARAAMLVSYVTGRWHRFAKSGFRQHPADHSPVHLALLLAA